MDPTNPINEKSIKNSESYRKLKDEEEGEEEKEKEDGLGEVQPTTKRKSFLKSHHISFINTSLDSKKDSSTDNSKANNRSAKCKSCIYTVTDYGTAAISPRVSLTPQDFKRMSHHSPFGGGSSFYYQMPGLYPPYVRRGGAKTNSCYAVIKGAENGINTPLILEGDELQIPIESEKEDEEEEEYDDDETIDSPGRKHKMYFSEFKILSRYSIPIIGSEVLRNTLLMMPVLFIGHRSAFELAAITLGSSYCNVTGWCLLIGMDSALDTLCSQAYAAARTREDKKKIGSILQRGFVILMAITLFIFALWEFTEPILLLCRQDPDISRVAGIYSKYSRFGLIPYVVFECEKKLMQIQGIMYVPTFIIGSALPVNALLHYYFIFSKWSPLPDELAYIGSPFSTAITFTYMSIVGIIYIKYVKGSECWGGINLKSIFNFKKWIEFLKLGIPGAIMVCNEWWAYEVCALIAGILGEIPLAIQSIFSSITNYSYNIPMGLSIATTLRLGYNLGEGNSKKSSATTKISILMAFAFGIINSLVLLIFRYKLPKIFTDDDEVIKGCSQILIIGAFYQLSDGLATIGNGILKGSGHQRNGALINFIAYWCIGLPLGTFLCFTLKLKLNGLWIGMASALFSVMALEFVTIYRINWEKEVEATVKRINKN